MSGKSAAPLLRMRDLRVQFGAQTVVQGIDLDIAAGEKVALVGESGLEPDRCVCFEYGAVMSRHTAQQRLPGNPGQMAGGCRNIAFPCQCRTEVQDGRIVRRSGQVEQHAVRPESAGIAGVQRGDQRYRRAPEQPGPVIVRLHLHPPFAAVCGCVATPPIIVCSIVVGRMPL